jgi:hypothetical protein
MPPADGGPAIETGSGNGSGSGSSGSSGGGSSSSSGSGSSSSGSGSGSSSGSGTSSGTVQDASAGGEGGGGADASPGNNPNAKQSIIWIPTYLGSFAANLKMVTSNPKSFTHVAPDIYQLNFAYTSGPAKLSGNSFDGLSVQQIAQQVHAAGMKLMPLVYAGAGNGGTDQGIQNILNDSPAGAQSSFISSMVKEAQTMMYDGWNLDFEVQGTNYSQYGTKYVTFLTAFKAALNAQNMILTVELGDWFTRQCGGDGLIDLTTIGPSVDRVIIMDYSGTYGTPVTSCPGKPPAQQSCANQFGALMNIMCDVSPSSAVSIGLIEGSGGSGTNPFLDQALNAVAAAGFTSVAVWPDATPFLNPANIPGGATWYSLLAGYMAK